MGDKASPEVAMSKLNPAIAASEESPPSLLPDDDVWGTMVVDAVYSLGDSRATHTPKTPATSMNIKIVLRPFQKVLANSSKSISSSFVGVTVEGFVSGFIQSMVKDKIIDGFSNAVNG
jgi:hypothetical protein